MKNVLLLASLVFSMYGHTHGDDDHSGPAALNPQNKGIVKNNEKYYIEVTHVDKKVGVYTYAKSTDLKNPQLLNPTTLKISATADLPKQKSIPLKLVPEGDHMMASFDSKGAHRVTILVKIEDGHGDVLKYTFEKNK